MSSSPRRDIAQLINQNYLEDTLVRIKKTSPGVSAISLMTREGLPISSVMSEDLSSVKVDDVLFSAMAATIQSVSERAVTELQKGSLEAVILQSDMGFLFLKAVGERAVLSVLTDRKDQIGLLYIVLERISKKLLERIEG
ncbi:MAG: roadblock/LC7 domain-containing protein [Promethearchaeota archaeon]